MEIIRPCQDNDNVTIQNTSPSSDTCHVSSGTFVTRHVEITPVSPPPNETILPWLIGDQLENLIPDKNLSSYPVKRIYYESRGADV